VFGYACVYVCLNYAHLLTVVSCRVVLCCVVLCGCSQKKRLDQELEEVVEGVIEEEGGDGPVLSPV
jgi:hypothetical protein